MPYAMPLLEAAEFHRRIARSLELEWDLAVAGLPEEIRAAVRRPGFSLIRTTHVLGQWVREPVREIRLSEACVLNHPWYAVVDVLRHETAHQLADELYGETEPPHGETFAHLCYFLHANPKASGGYPTLDDAVLTARADEDDRIMARIRKLLALSGSPNRHEAEQAMAKARELMAKYRVALPGQRTDSDFVSIVLGEPSLRHGLEVHALAALIREHYSVRTIWVPMAVPAAGKLGRALEICGTRQAVQLAHYAFDFVCHVIHSEWRGYRPGVRLGVNGRRDFALGMIAGFSALLAEQVRTSPQVAALVRREDPALEEYFDERHPHRHQTRAGRGVRVNHTVRRDGEILARRIGLRHGVQPATAGDRRRLLGGRRPHDAGIR
jgi:hypothetical protein